MFIFIVLNNNILYCLSSATIYKVFPLSSPLVLAEVFEVGLMLLLLLESLLTLAGLSASMSLHISLCASSVTSLRRLAMVLQPRLRTCVTCSLGIL